MEIIVIMHLSASIKWWRKRHPIKWI